MSLGYNLPIKYLENSAATVIPREAKLFFAGAVLCIVTISFISPFKMNDL